MSLIADVVKLKTGYANFVELKSAFEESQENTDRMAMYRPTKAHRQAFERICRGLYQPNAKKFNLLSGSYGTGKSHLCLMLANVLSRSSEDPEVKAFYDNYAKLDPEMGKKLKNIRKGGQYLVAICDYHSGRKFEDVVLKAIMEACSARGLEALVSTEFDEALRQLEEWKTKEGIRDFYQDFAKALGTIAPGFSVEQLEAGLKDFDSQALETFRAAFKETMGGYEFQPRSGNLIPIVRNLVRNEEFKKRFKGLAIIFDEFGFTLERAAYSKDILQGFMETICHNEPNVIFVGCIHKDFKAYADRYSQADAAVMSARINQVDLLNEGIEEIIGAIVETDKESQVWKEEISPRTSIFDQLVPPCKTLNLFPWIDDIQRIRQKVLEDIYGVHPMALSCLLHLSAEIGSDARSTFTFFSGDVGGASGSYADFIKNEHVLESSGKLNLLTPDRLLSFFDKEISPKNTELRERQRQFVNGYYASIETLRKVTEGELPGVKSESRMAILKTILIYHLCQIPTNLENIQFGLYCLSSTEKKNVEKILQELNNKGVIFYRRQSNTYELAAGTGEDPYELIERFVSDTGLHPTDLVNAFLEEGKGGEDTTFLEAKSYNLPYNEDKRCRMIFVQAKDLGTSLWGEIHKYWDETKMKPKDSFEGTLVYALCEDETDIRTAREEVKSLEDARVAVAIPHEPIPFTETLLKVKACRHFLPPNEAEKISAQTETRLRDIFENTDDGYLPTLKRILKTVIEGNQACWYTKNGDVLVDRPSQAHKPADVICERLFTKRCKVKHPDLNFCHDPKWQRGRNTALKQAVDNLLSPEQVYIDQGNPENHGEKRYLQKVLLKGAGALSKVSAEGPMAYFICEKDPEKIHNDFPLLRELLERLQNLEPHSTFQIAPFVQEMFLDPWGSGGTQAVLALAHAVRAYGERLVVYQDSTKMTEQVLSNYNDLVSLAADPFTKVVFEVRDISDAQHRFIERVAQAVGAPPLKHGETRSLNDAFHYLANWWEEVPQVAKQPTIFEKEHQSRLREFYSVFSELSNADRFDFILKKLPGIYLPIDQGTLLTKDNVEETASRFVQDVQLLDSAVDVVRQQLAEACCQVFGTTGDLIECEKAVNNWFEDLNPAQRDPHKCDDEEAQKLLHRLKDRTTTFDTKLTVHIPEDFGFGPVKNWHTIYVDDFARKLRQAKSEIDKAKPEVPRPDLDQKTYQLSKAEEFKIPKPSGTAKLVYTTDGSDPRQSETALSAAEDADLTYVLKDSPRASIRVRSVDNQGNFSEIVNLELVSKERQFDLKVEKNLLGDQKASFRCPKDSDEFKAVVNAVLKYGEQKNLLSQEEAQAIRDILQKEAEV